MDISREQASHSLKEISAAHQRSLTLQNYRHFAPHMLIWGVVWLIANSLSDFFPDHAGQIWPVLSVLSSTIKVSSPPPPTTTSGPRP